MWRILSLFVILMLVIVGCSEQNEVITLPNGDIQETTTSIMELPAFLDDQDETIRNVYQVAAQHQDLLQYIPCYCGCAESANHESNLHCFIGDSSTDDLIVWDDHSTRCGLCLETAAESIIMQREGKTVEEIRQYIDEKYEEGYPEPTPTPTPTPQPKITG